LLETNIFVPDDRQSITQPPRDPKLKQAFRQQYEQRRKSAMPRDVLPNDLYQDALLMEHGIKYCDEMDPNLSKDRYLKEKRHAVSIDSRARDTTEWPNPNHYVIELPDTYRQVKSIRLTGAIIPNTDQVINNNNNDIYFQIAYDGDPGDPLTPGVDQYHIIITPGNYKGTDFCTDACKKFGFEADFTKMEYSINQGLWGTSIGGKETLTSGKNLPEKAYPSQLQENGEKIIELGFEKGELISLDGEFYENGPEIIQALETVASKFAIGRDTHVGDTIIGIKVINFHPLIYPFFKGIFGYKVTSISCGTCFFYEF